VGLAEPAPCERGAASSASRCAAVGSTIYSLPALALAMLAALAVVLCGDDLARGTSGNPSSRALLRRPLPEPDYSIAQPGHLRARRIYNAGADKAEQAVGGPIKVLRCGTCVATSRLCARALYLRSVAIRGWKILRHSALRYALARPFPSTTRHYLRAQWGHTYRVLLARGSSA